MAYLGKTFKTEKAENYEAYVDALGLPADRAEQMKKINVTYKLVKNGNSYTLTLDYGPRTRDVTFTPGVEFDEVIRDDITAKTVVSVDGDTFTHVQKFPGGGVITTKREFSADTIKETLTGNHWDGTAYRYYKV